MICCNVASCAEQEKPGEASASPAKLSRCAVTRPPGPAAPLLPTCNLALQTDTHGGRQDSRHDNSCRAICTAGGYSQHCWLLPACGYHLCGWKAALPLALLWLSACGSPFVQDGGQLCGRMGPDTSLECCMWALYFSAALSHAGCTSMGPADHPEPAVGASLERR